MGFSENVLIFSVFMGTVGFILAGVVGAGLKKLILKLQGKKVEEVLNIMDED